MYKHIKVSCSITSGYTDEAVLTIIEQTHIGQNFGEHYSNYFIHNGIALISSAFPEYWEGDAHAISSELVLHTLYVGGLSTPKGLTRIPSSVWPPVKEAIQAYNEYFKE